MSGPATLTFAAFAGQIAVMNFNALFNYTVEMTPRRTAVMCIAVAVFFTAAAFAYDPAGVIDTPVKRWFGWK